MEGQLGFVHGVSPCVVRRGSFVVPGSRRENGAVCTTTTRMVPRRSSRRSRTVVRAVIEPKEQPTISPPPTPEKETEEEVVQEPEKLPVIRKRSSIAGVVYDRLIDTGSDVGMHLGRLIRKPQIDENTYRPRLIILGSGWGAHSLAKVVDAVKYEVVLISPRNYFLFTPMLPSTAVGTIEFRSIVDPIRKANELIDYYEASCVGVDSSEQVIKCRSVQQDEAGAQREFSIPYDFLVLGVGVPTNTFGIPGVDKYCFFLKEIDDSRRLRTRIIENFERASLPHMSDEDRSRLLSFVVVGGGPTGVEFASELADLVTQDLSDKYVRVLKYVRVMLLQRQQSILTQFDQTLQARAMENFQDKVEIITGADVIEVQATEICLKDGRKISYGLALWAAGNGTQPLIKELIKQLPEQKTARGRIIVDDWLRVKGAANVFALGDCSAMEIGPLPATAQVAGQQGAYLGRLFNRDYCLQCDYPFATAKPNSSISTLGLNDLAKPFQFLSLGIMAYIGDEKSVIQVDVGDRKVKISGALSYLLWQSVYATKQVSFKNRVLVLFDWVKTKVFGRDLSQF